MTDHDVTLRVNGKEFSGWMRVTISAGIDRISRSFDVEITRQWPQTGNLTELELPVIEGDLVEVLIGTDKVITGYVDATPLRYDARQISASVNGRSKTEDLIDCSAPTQPGQFTNRTLAQIVTTLAQPFGVNVVSNSPESNTLTSFQIDYGETVEEALNRLLGMEQVLAFDNKSLGTLTIDLIAKTGGFISGMNQAERASEKWGKQVQKDAETTSAAIAGTAAAAIAAGAAIGAAGFQLLKSTSKQIAETDRWAKSLNIATQDLLAWQFAAEKAGVTGDQMADIFKDIGDKIGDAVLNKSGEAVDALNALGLSAEKLSKVPVDKQLLAISEALGKIGTHAEKTTILESLGNDLSKLLPLFDNNNKKLEQFISLAKDYGIAPDPQSIDDLVKVNTMFEDMEAQVQGLKMEIAAGLAKVDLSPLQSSLGQLRDVLTDPQILQGITNLVSEVAQLAGWLVKAAASAGELAANTGTTALIMNSSLLHIPRMQMHLEVMKRLPPQ